MDPARGGKRSLPLSSSTPDRQPSAPKRRQLVPDTRNPTVSRIPPEMAGQMATFRLVGSPKRKAYKPVKRTPATNKGRPVVGN